ncbi:MAG: flagellar motor protein MotB, partial [Nitrosomonas sp.]|nr:flagellar motor protein MotB [Nitrosomonas sp.]
VTAMMAFFLLMWLLGSSTKAKLEGISEYFKTPLKVALSGGSSVANTDSILVGGGEDFTRQEGQVLKGVVKEEKVDEKTKKVLRERAERIRLEGLKKKIEQAIEANPSLKKFENQLLLDITTDGLRIQIVDEQNRPMFALGKAELQSYTKTILREIGKMLNDVPNKISLSGHTDAKPFPSGDKGFSNWELSADRANTSRRELVAGGMDTDKVLKVVGLSSAVLFDKNDAFNPINRRISIVVMNEKAVNAVTMDGDAVEVDMEERSNIELLKTP